MVSWPRSARCLSSARSEAGAAGTGSGAMGHLCLRSSLKRRRSLSLFARSSGSDTASSVSVIALYGRRTLIWHVVRGLWCSVGGGDFVIITPAKSGLGASWLSRGGQSKPSAEAPDEGQEPAGHLGEPPLP
jgi:hypothetical protein